MFRKLILNKFLVNKVLTKSYVRKAGNPGINKQLKLMKSADESIDDSEALENMESDFMNSHNLHKLYEKETKEHDERIKLFTIKNKYFKELQPNFLTYAEKEQIKLLNSRDPEEWNPEKLSESFPAVPSAIVKIIKAKWIPRSEKRVKIHDQNVMKNWQTFRKGKFSNLDENLCEHLKQFVKRTEKDLKNVKIDLNFKRELPKPGKTEFLNIITNFTKYEETNTNLIESTNDEVNENSNPFRTTSGEEETFLSDKITDKRLMRFRDLKPQKGSEPIKNEFQLYQFDNPSGTGVITTNNERNSKLNKFKTGKIRFDEDVSKILKIKEQIKIPNNIWKRGATYRVEDCYYDDDGEFLYRVPGMTGKNL